MKKTSFEIIFVVLIATIAIFLAKYPTYYHATHTSKEYWFARHASWFDAWDVNIYLAYLRYGQRAGLMLENVFTTQEHDPAFVYQFYTSWGVLNRALNISPTLLFHIASILSSIILILSIYWLSKIFFQRQIIRLSAYATGVLGAGLGWITHLKSSGDLIYAGFTTTNAFERGHDALSTALLIFSICALIKYLKNSEKKYLLGGVSCAFINLVIHPTFVFFYIPAFSIFAFLDFAKNRRLNSVFYLVSIAILFFSYYLVSLKSASQNPGFAGVVSQELPDVQFVSLLLGFGIMVPFIIYSLTKLKGKDEKNLLIKTLFVTEILLLFSPLGFNLHFLKGLFVFGTILAFAAISKIKFKSVALGLVILIISSSLLARINIFKTLISASKENPFFFLSAKEHEALNYLSTLPTDSSVLALYFIGNYIPAQTNNRVYYGHGLQTPNGKERLKLAREFYTKMGEEEQKEFLKTNSIDFVYYGQEEAKLRQLLDLEVADPFEFNVVYTSDKALVYDVRDI